MPISYHEKKMKLFFFVVCSALSMNAWALGGYGTLSGDDKKVTDNVKTKLDISEEDAFRIYEAFLKSHLNSKNWQYNLYNNESLDSTKVGKAPNKTLLVNFVTDNRYINLTFVKYQAEKQILIQSIETLPRGSQAALDKYSSLKTDTAWSVDSDETEFSAFTKKGSTEKVKILVNSGVGGVQYIDFYTFDLKK